MLRQFTARIIAVDATTKIVRFSLNPHILALDGRYATFPHAVGAIVKNAQVIRVDPGIGALLALPPTESAGAEGEDEAREQFFDEMDRELGNNLRANSEYRAASNVSTAYVHISKSIDTDDNGNNKTGKKGQQQGGTKKQRTPEALFARHFSISARIPSLRILSTSNTLDNIASCATAKSIVEAHVLTHADLRPAAIYREVPVVQLLDSGGVLVDLGLGTQGIVPSLHLFDKGSHGDATGYRQQVRAAKYRVGNRITVRCLTVDAPTRQCVLTAKKTLLMTDVENPITDYASIEPGRVAAGFVSRVDDAGLTVTFYDNVHGRVTGRSLAAELGVEDVRVNYAVGDVVMARVVACERRRNRHVSYDAKGEAEEYYYRLRLSLKTVVEEKKVEDTTETAAEEKTHTEEGKATSLAVPLIAGSVLMPKRMKVLELVNCLHRDDGAFLPGYAVVSIKSKFFTGAPPKNNSNAVECKLPYDQLLDSYNSNGLHLSNPPVELDNIAQAKLIVGKRIDAEGMVLSVPDDLVNAFPLVSLRPSLIDTIKTKRDATDDFAITCPSPRSTLFMGAYVRGYVARIDERYGAFVRFTDGLTGLIPKLKKGLEEKLFETVLCRVTALDITSSPPKILLKKVKESEVAKKKRKKENKSKGANEKVGAGPIRVGQVVGNVKVVDINFARAKVYLLDHQEASLKIRARIHVTMALANALEKKSKLSKKEKQFKEEHKIGKCHPFYNWKIGDVISDVRCVAVDNRDGMSYVELANMTEQGLQGAGQPEYLPAVVQDPPPGSILSSIITSISSASNHQGLWVQVCPGVTGFVSALELSTDPDALNDLPSNWKIGSRITCCVMDKVNPTRKEFPLRNHRRHQIQLDDDHDNATNDHQALELSVLLVPGNDLGDSDTKTDNNKQRRLFTPTKPRRGDLVVGRIHTRSRAIGRPALMLNLRGNFVGRCCITELADMDDWENMPLGNAHSTATAVPVSSSKAENAKDQQRVVSDSDAEHSRENAADDHASDDGENESNSGEVSHTDFPDGKYVKCRVLGTSRFKAALDLSMRDSRLKEGNLEDDLVPNVNEMIHAYVVSTSKMGCFVRLSRSVEGRVMLKELSDEFIPNPQQHFPEGRLVVGKVKNVKKGNQTIAAKVDIDMRESVVLASGNRLTIDDIKEKSKYTGIVTRVESYGVFVRIDNSDVSGLAHVSECSDTFVKNLFNLYNPGDFVKLIVINKDKDQRRLGFSLKASNFVDDDDSDDDDSDDDTTHDSDSSSKAMNEDGSDKQSIDSEDEDFASKLAKKMTDSEGMDVDEESMDSDSSGGSSSGSASESSDSDGEEADVQKPKQKQMLCAMETNVGFDWGNTSKTAKTSKLADSSDDESSSSNSSDEKNNDADSGFKTNSKSQRKAAKAAAKRKEEEETSKREQALADGTADETPETSADFERLIAGSPNSSEVWIKYMAFHLSLADIDSARNVANRGFERIEFRQEGEKLNVWTALLTLELKYGTDKSLHETIDRACQQNNPKQVHLRVCELLEKEVDAATSVSGSSDLNSATTRANEMFTKMCKKFKSKKSVWLAHFRYLLKGSRHEEAHALLKRSLQSLPSYKHQSVLSKFAQLEFELGSPERGRTIFNSLLEKYPKLDLLFVSIDKEVKHGDISKARALFESVANPVSHDRKFKLSDKQMKSLFKKWYRMEEDHGNEESQERVKEEARAFVAKTSA